jgi:hypothetical protein
MLLLDTSILMDPDICRPKDPYLMTQHRSMVKMISAAIVLFCLTFSPAMAQERSTSDIDVMAVDGPAGDAAYLLPLRQPQVQPDLSGILRTGVKKGIKDTILEAEVFAGPDAAVLKSGFFEPWQALLAEFREPMVLVEPGHIAGIEKTKPYLIIPSGALHGFSGSEFFKAGLAEYTRSGGVIICFSQQNGIDFTALPIPGTKAIEAAGWQQDSGPLFRSSLVQGQHFLFAGTKRTVPNVETSGYLISYPSESQVLLSRSDGFPTLIIYPYGSGWVVVSTVFSDFSYGYGHLEAEEKVLLRDILGWAKSPANIVQTSAGDELTIPLSVQGPELGEASAVKVFIIGPDATRGQHEEIIEASIKADQFVPLKVRYTVPTDIQPGLYHIEYLLLDAAGHALGARLESNALRFAVGQPQVAAPVPRSRQPIAGFPAPFQVLPAVERSHNSARLNLRIKPGPAATVGQKETYSVRVMGQERFFSLGTDMTVLSFPLSEEITGERIAFTFYHSGGRSLARGSVRLAGHAGPEPLALDKQSYFAGQNVNATLTPPRRGEFILTTPGRIDKKMITGKGHLQFTLPADLPSGTYRFRWDIHPLQGAAKQGDVPVTISGYRVRIQDAVLEHRVDRGTYTSTARMRIYATQKLSAQLKLWLSAPDGTIIPVVDNTIALQEGRQEIPCTFTMKPESAGIWQLHSRILMRLPEGPGLPRDPLTIAEGRMLFDIGESALLGVVSDRPVYYEPSGPVQLTAYLFGKGRAKIELSLDDKRLEKETIDLTGRAVYPYSVPSAKPGSNSIKATLTTDALQSAAEHTFVYGARFPDLVVTLKAPEPAGKVMPVSLVIRNQGKSPSGPSKAALYEGDPVQGGRLIARSDVPPLGPNTVHEAVIEWPLFKRTGTRKLTAVADVNNVITETNKNNNTASAEVTIPELLLSVTTGTNAVNANEPIMVGISATNLTADAYKDLGVSVDLIDSAGKAVSAETVTLSALAAGSTEQMDRMITPAALPVGAYQLRVQASKENLVTKVSSAVTVLPTLMLSGSLDATSRAAALCMPLSIPYSMKNAGNLTPASGTLTIEIRAAGTGAVVFTRQVPFTMDRGSIKIDHVNILPGEHIIALKASAASKEHGISRNFTLAELPLTVSPPVTVKKGPTVFPRVLLWLGRIGRGVRHALAEKIVQQAFTDDDIYFTVVEHVDEFTSKFLAGAYNTAVLFEPDEPLERPRWLQDRIARGNGLVIIGSEDRTKAIAEDFGFQFSESPSTTGATILFSEGLGLGLSGTMPVRGRFLLPQKTGAQPAALFSNNNQPAALIDQLGDGRVIVLPFSFTHSALDTGAVSLYSLLLRTAARSATPQTDAQTGVSSTEIAVSAPAGPIRARLVETLPQGSRVLWANSEGVVKGNTITYEVTADAQQQKLLYLYRSPDSSPGSPVTEVFYDCKGKFVSQGKLE